MSMDTSSPFDEQVDFYERQIIGSKLKVFASNSQISPEGFKD
jgi:hypothetical protein